MKREDSRNIDWYYRGLLVVLLMVSGWLAERHFDANQRDLKLLKENVAALTRRGADADIVIALLKAEADVGVRASGGDLLVILEAMLRRDPETIDFHGRDRQALEDLANAIRKRQAERDGSASSER